MTLADLGAREARLAAEFLAIAEELGDAALIETIKKWQAETKGAGNVAVR